MHGSANINTAHRKNLNLNQKITPRKDRWKKQEVDYRHMLDANTSGDVDISSYLANLDVRVGFNLQSKEI